MKSILKIGETWLILPKITMIDDACYGGNWPIDMGYCVTVHSGDGKVEFAHMTEPEAHELAEKIRKSVEEWYEIHRD